MSTYYEPGYSELLVITNQFDKYELKFHKIVLFFSANSEPAYNELSDKTNLFYTFCFTSFRLQRTYK
jgi:hypothetical protein